MNLDTKFDFDKSITKKQIGSFVDMIQQKSARIGFKVSSRGWGYILEQSGYINKDQFNKVERIINKCRKDGLLPVDFVAEEESRSFREIHNATTKTPEDFIYLWLHTAYNCGERFEPDWWEGEEYYIQMVVEKVDLVTLFQPICRNHHVPIANSKGWSSIGQRADYARRFAEAQARGMKCVLLYCGDHDPDGLRIADTIRQNLADIQHIRWSDGFKGYDPADLIIDRFGLTYEFIIAHNLTWIDNLITGSGKDLAEVNNDGTPAHRNGKLPYVKRYLDTVGERKCEANALVVTPDAGRRLCFEAINKYLGESPQARFNAKKVAANDTILSIMNRLEIKEPIERALKILSQ